MGSVNAAQSFLQHLLVPRSPYGVTYKQAVLDVSTSIDFLTAPTVGVQHLFTDGSCTRHAGGTMPLAAWSVVNASNSEIVAGGHLSGLTQTSNCVELQAIIAAVRWTVFYQCKTQVWCDSRNTVCAAFALQQGDLNCLRGTPDNLDLLETLADLFLQIEPQQLSLSWIPSHLNLTLCEDSFEEWICTWNDVADRIAYTPNESRDTSLERLLHQQTQWYNDWHFAVQTLQSFYLAVAATSLHADQQPE